MKRNPMFWRKKPRIAMYVPWLNSCTSGMPRSPNVDVYVVDPNNPKQPETIYSTVDGESPEQTPRINTVNHRHEILNTHFSNAIDNKSYFMGTTKNTGQANVKALTKQFESTNSSVDTKKANLQVDTNSLYKNITENNKTKLLLDTNSLYENIPKCKVVEEIASPETQHSSDDTDDSWDSDICANSLYDTNRCNPSTEKSHKKCSVKKGRRVVSNARQYVNQRFKRVSTLLNTKDTASSSNEIKVEKPKPHIVKSDLVSTTNVQVQNMISSTSNLKKT